LSQQSIPLYAKFLIVCGNNNIKKFQLCEDIKETLEGDLGYLTIDRNSNSNNWAVVRQNKNKKILVYNSENYNNFIPESIIRYIYYRGDTAYIRHMICKGMCVNKEVPICNIIMTVNSVDSIDPGLKRRAIIIHLNKKRKYVDSP
jgi:hypothetical protein